MIECLNLKIGYESKSLLAQDLNITLKAQSTYVLLGKNGSGKSTFLKTLAGLISPLAGVILYPQDFKLNQEMGIVLTDEINVPYLTVRDLLKLGRYPFSNFWGDLKNEDEKIIDEILKELNLVEYQNAQFAILSDGLKQRVLIARALVKKPKLLLLDEPFSYLDPPNKLLLVKILKEIVTKFSLTLIFSTHDWDLVSEYYQEILYIDNSKKLVESSVEEICEKKLLQEIFDLGDHIFQDQKRFAIK